VPRAVPSRQQPFRGIPAERLQSRCTIECCSLAELLWVPLAQLADDGKRGQLRLRSKPARTVATSASIDGMPDSLLVAPLAR